MVKLINCYSVSVITHNYGGAWGKVFPSDDESTNFYKDMMNTYFEGGEDIIIINMQEVVELKPKSTFRMLRRVFKSREDTYRKKFVFHTDDQLEKERMRITNQLIHDDYECEYFSVYFLVTAVCAKNEIATKLKMTMGEFYFTNKVTSGQRNYQSSIAYLTGQKGGFIVEIMADGHYLLNAHVHLDAFDVDTRADQLSAMMEMINDHKNKIINDNGAKDDAIFYFLNGDFNSRLTDEEKNEVYAEGDPIKNMVELGTSKEEYKNQHLGNHNLKEKDIDFVPTYKLNEKESQINYLALISCSSTDCDDGLGDYYVDGGTKPKMGYTDRFFYQGSPSHFVEQDPDDESDIDGRYDLLMPSSVFSDHIPVKFSFTINADVTDNEDVVFERQDSKADFDDDEEDEVTYFRRKIEEYIQFYEEHLDEDESYQANYDYYVSLRDYTDEEILEKFANGDDTSDDDRRLII